MPQLRKNELKHMNQEQLKEKLTELKKELMKINAQISTGTTAQSPGRAKTIKKTIARIVTFANQKKLEGGTKPKK